jgi:O-antigen ligase
VAAGRKKKTGSRSAGAAAHQIEISALFWRRTVWLGVAIGLLGSALLIDPRAEAAFDAPKRVCVIASALICVFALLGNTHSGSHAAISRAAKLILVCTALAAVCVLVATLASPHPQLAWPSIRRALFFALFLPIGASLAVAGSGGRVVFGLFGMGCTINLAMSLTEAAGWQDLDVAQIGGRFTTGALLGNEGYVALAAALIATACAAIVMGGSRMKHRIGAAAVAAIALLTIAINHQVTSALAFGAALIVMAAMRWRQRWLAAILFGGIAVVVTTAVLPPLRSITWMALPVGGVDGYQRLTTYRLGAWAAALHMSAARPLTGYGLGSYGAEQQVHRLAAELSTRERFVQPVASSFVYAHNDYLQLAAEAGIPALLFALGALTAILAGLARVRRPADDIERLLLLGILTSGAVAALTWFPLQIPFTALALLLAAGRAWRIIAHESAP